MSVRHHTDPAPDHAPVVPPPHPKSLSTTLERNIQALIRRREEEAASASLEARVAEAITAFTGSMTFVYIHLGLFGFWISANLGWIPGVAPWDQTLVILAMIASVEAIFLSTFVLISQNRMAKADDKRADLNLQISLLNEHETTKLIALVSAIAEKMEIKADADPELGELKKNVAPEAVLDRIEEASGERPHRSAP